MELARNIRVDCVRRLSPTPARESDVGSGVADAVALMRQEKVGCLLVCDSGVLVGIFTERDLLARVLGPNLPMDTPLRDVMTPGPVTIQPDDSIYCALRKMREGGHRHLPVVDADNRPQGILSVKRVVRYVVEHFPATVYNQPPDPGSIPKNREGA